MHPIKIEAMLKWIVAAAELPPAETYLALLQLVVKQYDPTLVRGVGLALGVVPVPIAWTIAEPTPALLV